MQYQHNLPALANDPAAKILVVESFTNLWFAYQRAIPHPDRLVMVRDVTEAAEAMRKHHIEAVVIQGLAREHHDLFTVFSYGSHVTHDFIHRILMMGFGGPVFVVSTTLSTNEALRMMVLSDKIHPMSKQRFFEDAATILAAPAHRFTQKRTARTQLERSIERAPERLFNHMMEMLDWLDAFEETINQSVDQPDGIGRIWRHLVQLGVGRADDCA